MRAFAFSQGALEYSTRILRRRYETPQIPRIFSLRLEARISLGLACPRINRRGLRGVPAQRAQRQSPLPAELVPAQPARFVLSNQLLDLLPAPPAPYSAHMFFIHALTSSSISSPEQMVSSDSYKLIVSGGGLLAARTNCFGAPARAYGDLNAPVIGTEASLLVNESRKAVTPI